MELAAATAPAEGVDPFVGRTYGILLDIIALPNWLFDLLRENNGSND